MVAAQHAPDRPGSASPSSMRSSAARWAACRPCSGRSRTPTPSGSAVIIAATGTSSPQQIAFNEIGRQAIMADPAWNGGDYYGTEPARRPASPWRGWSATSRISRTQSMHEKFGRRLQDRDEVRVRLRHRVRGRVVPPSPGRSVHQAVRRELVPLHHQGPRLLRPLGRRVARGRPRRTSRRRCS